MGAEGDGGEAVPLHILNSAVARCLHAVKTACLGLRSVRNYTTPFHNFLQNYFTPFSFRSCGVFFENSFILDYAAFGTMQLRFIIFYKIISLRSVPHNQARPTANPPSPINCYKQIQKSRFGFVLRTDATPSYRLGNPPSFHSGVCPTAVINYFALYSEAGSHPRLKLRTAYALFRSPGLCPSGSSSCRRDVNRAVQGRVPFRVKSANKTTSGSRLSECAARVKAAWVEFSENVSSKSGCVFVQLLTPKADLCTDGAERIRIANRPCRLVQST